MAPEPKTAPVRHGQYLIRHSAAQPFPFEQSHQAFKFSNILAWSIWLCYTATQAIIIYSINKSTGTSLWPCWIGWFAEVCLTLNEFSHGLHIIVRLLKPAVAKLRPHYELLQDAAPSIDAFIPCCGENPEVVLNTMISVAAQDYPASQLRIVVLDDGHDESLENAVKELALSGRSKATILYRSRQVKDGTQSYFKAGNLRYGVDETAALGGSEYIASIDADMIARPDWLRRMIPHLIIDPKVGMVNQPQQYYNTSKSDLLAEGAEFDIWYTIFEALNDRVGEAMCQGSGFIVRRDALDAVGGWPLAYTGEDIMCSLKLLFAGWKLVYIREYLQLGLTPDSLQSRLTQKTRWAGDHIEYLRNFGLYLVTTKIGALTYRELTSITTTIGLVLMPLVLLATMFSSDEIQLSSGQWIWLRVMLVLTFVSNKINDYVVYHHVGLTRLANYKSLNFWYAPSLCGLVADSYDVTVAAVSLIQKVLPFSTVAPSFLATGAYSSSIRERSRQHRARLTTRIRSSCIPLCISYTVCSSGILLWCLRCCAFSQPSKLPSRLGVVLIYVLPGLAVKMASCIWKLFIPIMYMIVPPDVPGWRELLKTDTNGSLQPKKLVRTIMNPSGSWQDTATSHFVYDALETLVLLGVLRQGA